MNRSRSSVETGGFDEDAAMESVRILRARQEKEGRWDLQRGERIPPSILQKLGRFAARHKVLSLITLGTIATQVYDITDGEYDTPDHLEFAKNNPGEVIKDGTDKILDTSIFVLDATNNIIEEHVIPALENMKSNDEFAQK